MTTDRCPACGALSRTWSSAHAPNCELQIDPRVDLAVSRHTARPIGDP